MNAYAPGDRVYRYVPTGGGSWEPQPLTVVRVNRTTITVRTDAGNTFRTTASNITGRWADAS